jgi:hypothetical protein
MFTDCNHSILKPLREKAFDLQADCLLQLQRDGAFLKGMQWMHAWVERMMNLANETRTRDVERFWLGTFAADTVELILQEEIHRTSTTSQLLSILQSHHGDDQDWK